ncbi:MAG: purine-nucleoside phosphorylase [Spirochaetales bacterium]|nr:purine-nucleoside phosphorylase [Spirochaetales bacterium]MBQ5365558.1 purine-nucleoside phosphorylase [Spirochaetales bacterium]
MDNLMKKLKEAKDYIEKQTKGLPLEVGLVLGSGLGDLAQEVRNPVIIDYKNIPNFPVSTVAGHAGRLVIGELQGKNVLCMQGRFHFYEGYSMDLVVFPIQVMKMLGIKYLILTNAAGCVNVNWKPGTLMMIKDHIKLVAECPMRGHNEDELGLRFFDMSRAYDPDLQKIVRKVAEKNGVPITEGVYMFFAGPNFESPAEVRAARILGADAVGMSTVPEAIAAAHCGLRTIGISCMTNMAAGILDQPLGHEEVMETGLRVKGEFSALIRGIVSAL